MTAPAPPEFPRFLDSTMMENAVCPRKFFNAFIRRWQPQGGSIHLHAGQVFAGGLDAYRRSYYSDGPWRGNHDHAMGEAWRTAVELWSDYTAPPESPKKLWRILEAIDGYFREWPAATDYVQPMMFDNKPAAEISFAIPLSAKHPLTGDPLQYVGRIDYMGRFEGTAWVVDEKTTSQLGKTWYNKWDLRGQFQGYMRIAREYGYEVMGTKVRAACFRSKGVDFAEATVHYRPWLAEEWWQSINFRAQQLVAHYNLEYWPKVFNEVCGMYSGCDFRPLCLHRFEETLAPVEYEKHTWDPVNRIDKVEPLT